MKILEGDIDGTSTIPLNEQVKLYKMLEENEAIDDFLCQEPETNYNNESETEKISCGEEEEEDNILIADEHPEQFTSLEEL